MFVPEELIEKAAGGNQAAIRELLEQHLPMIQAVVRRRMSQVLRAREESIDVVQSVCRQVLENLDRYEQRTEEGFGAWLLKLVEHKLVDHYRGLKREKRDIARLFASQLAQTDILHFFGGMNAYRAVYLPTGARHGEAFCDMTQPGDS